MEVIYISTKQAAKILGVTTQYVCYLARKGVLASDPNWDGRERRVSRSDVFTFKHSDRRPGRKKTCRKTPKNRHDTKTCLRNRSINTSTEPPIGDENE